MCGCNHQQQYYPNYYQCNSSYQYQTECSCRKPPSPTIDNVISVSSPSITYNSTTLTYYSIGNYTNTSSTSAPGVVTTDVPISYLFPRNGHITKFTARAIKLNAAALTGNLTITAQIYVALPVSNGAQLTYANVFTQQVAVLTGSIGSGSTYTIDADVNIPITKNSSVAIVFSAVNTVAETAQLNFSAALIYC